MLKVILLAGNSLAMELSAFRGLAEGLQRGLQGDRLEVSEFEVYPGYNGPLRVVGGFAVYEISQEGGPVLFTEVDLTGLEPSDATAIKMGGVHIHEGKTCLTSGGHFWNKERFPVDPWLFTKWTSNFEGKCAVAYPVNVGFSLLENDGHAVVVHDSTGARVACGILRRVQRPEPQFVFKLVGNGFCRTARGTSGKFSLAQVQNRAGCQKKCLDSRKCVGYEYKPSFSQRGSPICELHEQRVTRVKPDRRAVCFSKELEEPSYRATAPTASSGRRLDVASGF